MVDRDLWLQGSKGARGLGQHAAPDVALKFPQDDDPTILLSAQKEVDQAKFDRPSPVVSTIFCDKLKKGQEVLSSRGILVGPIQDGGDMQFFEIRDTEGHLIQVCKES